MLQVEKILFDEISKLPFYEAELILEDDEYNEFYDRLKSSDFITSDELSAKIRALPSLGRH